MRRLASAFAARRVSVATWSLRERPVWRRPPAGPMRRVSSASIAMWMSSSAMSKTKEPASISASMASSPAQMASASSSGMMPCAASIFACARDPAISCLYSALSTGSDAPNARVTGAASSSNLPLHSAIRADLLVPSASFARMG